MVKTVSRYSKIAVRAGIWVAILMLFALWLVYEGFFEVVDFYRYSVKVTGVVRSLDITEQPLGIKFKSWRKRHHAQVFYRDTAGKEYSHEFDADQFLGSSSSLAVGDSIDFYYDKRNPNNLTLNSVFAIWRPLIIDLSVAGCLSIWAFIKLRAIPLKHAFRPAAPLATAQNVEINDAQLTHFLLLWAGFFALIPVALLYTLSQRIAMRTRDEKRWQAQACFFISGLFTLTILGCIYAEDGDLTKILIFLISFALLFILSRMRFQSEFTGPIGYSARTCERAAIGALILYISILEITAASYDFAAQGAWDKIFSQVPSGVWVLFVVGIWLITSAVRNSWDESAYQLSI